ncbi:MAG: serine hydrolase [Pseudomonadota bacterium]
MWLDDAKQLAVAMAGGVLAFSVPGCDGEDGDATDQALPDYAEEAQRVIETFDATGMTAIVMVDGEIVYQDVFGSAEAGTERPVTIDMLFPIGSISKTFTATALAMLVDQGLVDWDAPMTTYIPEFEIYDPWITEQFSLRDAATHRSGLPFGAGDLLFWPDGEGDVADLINALPYFQPTSGFRTDFTYSNLLYIVMGEVVARVSGKSWADFVTEEIFEPLDMQSCAADRSRIKSGADVVRGHQFAPGADQGTPVDERTVLRDWVAPAGGIYCSADDMMKWAQFWFDGGLTSGGERLLSEAQIAEQWRGITPLPAGTPFAQRGSTLHTLYGLGWNVQDFKGEPMVSHAGGVAGVISNLILLPQQKTAIFASINDERLGAFAWTFQIADGFVGGQDIDHVKIFGDRAAMMSAMAQSALDNAATPPEDAAAPTLPLSAYAGDYEDAWYGRVTITADTDGLSIDMSRSELLDAPLTHFNGDQFVAAWPERSLNADAFVTFAVEDGAVTGFKMKAVSATTDFSYNFHDLNLVRVQAGE